MIDDIFVFDNAIHCYDLSDDNLVDRPDARFSRDLLLALGAGGRWADYNDGSIEFKRRWTIEDLYSMVFEDAPTDMAMVQVVPIFDWFKDSFSPILTQHSMAQRYPGQVVFCGGVDLSTRESPTHSSSSIGRSRSSEHARSSSTTDTSTAHGHVTTRSSPIRSTNDAWSLAST